MFETRFVLKPTKFAMESEHLQQQYYRCWETLRRNFDPR
jgi:homogentisate 1,2-dioxygenase